MHQSTLLLSLTVMAAIVHVTQAQAPATGLSDIICGIIDFLVNDILGCETLGESFVCSTIADFMRCTLPTFIGLPACGGCS